MFVHLRLGGPSEIHPEGMEKSPNNADKLSHFFVNLFGIRPLKTGSAVGDVAHVSPGGENVPHSQPWGRVGVDLSFFNRT